MFAGINMFWARLRLIFKISLRRAQNIFMPKNIHSITINITLEGRFYFWLISYYFSVVCFFSFLFIYFLTAVVCVFGSMSSSTTM